jgi:UDP:flavonoid glycosyltransferase YjiC (YdhE family)
MRVLCSTTPMEGIFGPFIPLGRALAEAGHDVIVATGSNLQSAVESNGFEYVQAGLSAWDGVRGAADDPRVQAAPDGDRIAFPAAMFGYVHPTAKLPVLRELAAARAIDLIIHPPVDLSSPLLAAELELPTACYGFGQPLDPQVLAAMAERIRPAWESANLEPDPHGGIYRGRYLDPRPPSLHAADEVLAEGGTLAIRPEIPGEPTATLPPWTASLGHRPAVYVSLGTAPLFNQPDKFTPLLEGLAELDLDVIVTVSNLNDPEAFAKPHANVHIERWLPLAPVLPRCAAVLCHAGAGTTLAALAAGLPLVLVPQGADQFDNARACQRAGAARVLPPDQVTAPAIRDAISAVLDTNSTERIQALRLADQIASMPPAAQIAETLDAAVRDAHESERRVRAGK